MEKFPIILLVPGNKFQLEDGKEHHIRPGQVTGLEAKDAVRALSITMLIKLCYIAESMFFNITPGT